MGIKLNKQEPTMEKIITTVCMYCGKILKVQKANKKGISHGICDDCYEGKIREYRQKKIIKKIRSQ